MKKYLLVVLFWWKIPLALAQAPAAYYDNADSLIGENLRIALRNIISNHNQRSYGDLWQGYRYADRLPDSTIWDMYSHVPGGPQPYTFNYSTDQCGNYRDEGDCYNREHTWPRSKFGNNMPMESDLVLVIPTDGKVNNNRGNLPYGSVTSPSWTSLNGSKVGANNYPGSPNSEAFEPIDAYKGDIARIMFYVVTRYYKLDAGWSEWEMGAKAELRPWAKEMFLEWHRADPVSDKERNRNNAIFTFQDNRNPYVDRPEFVDCVFDPPNCPWASTEPSSLAHLLTNDDVRLRPNPSQNDVQLSFTTTKTNLPMRLSVTDITGRVIYEATIDPNNSAHTIPSASWNTGMYIIKLHNEQAWFSGQFVKN